MTHTPAPWDARRIPQDSRDDKYSYWVDGTSGVPLADVRDYPDGMGEANARLIAAAPDLLDALQDILSDLEHGDPGADLSFDMADRARATIKKAGG